MLIEHSDLANGQAVALVRADRAATVVLSASYDPGWQANVDGHPAPTVMVAPALVGVVVGPGTHTVAFRYGGYGSYDVLFVLALAVFAVMAAAPWLARCRAATPLTATPSRDQDQPTRERNRTYWR